MTSAAEKLRRKADDYKALGEEHADVESAKVAYQLVEITLREVALVLEELEAEIREAA